MKTFLTDLLKPLAVALYNLIVSIPLPAVRFFFLGMLLVLAIWVFSLPVQRAKNEDGSPRSWITDLRVMAFGLLALQSLFYIFL